MQFLQALILSVGTGVVALAFAVYDSLKGSFDGVPRNESIEGVRPDRRNIITSALAAFGIALGLELAVMASHIVHDGFMTLMTHALICLSALATGRLIADATQDRSSLSTKVHSIVCVAFIVAFLFTLGVQAFSGNA